MLLGSGGLNLRDQPRSVAATQLVDSLNWGLDEQGALVKRLGYVAYAQLPALPLEMALFNPSGQSPVLVIACQDGNVYTSPGDGTFTQIATGLSPTAVPSFCQVGDKLYWSNGSDPVQQWDGTTLLALSPTNEVQQLRGVGTITGGYTQMSVPGGALTAQISEVQTLSLDAGVSAGTFKVTFNGQQSAAINYNSSPATVQAALQALSSIGAGNCSVTGAGNLPANTLTVTFTGTLANQSQPLMTTADTLTGGSSHVSRVTAGNGIPWNCTASQLQTLLNTAYGAAAPFTCSGGPLPATPISVTFGGVLADAAQALLGLVSAATNLAGGGSLTISETTRGIGNAPKGAYLCTWRNRLWVSGDATHPHRVSWSQIGDPTQWYPTDYVDIYGPRGDQVTALAPSPNIGSASEGADGVLVFERRALHRVTDDSDNINGVITGGANVLVDGSNGCVSHRTLAHVEGRLWTVSVDGVYSTDGHKQLVLESSKVGRVFSGGATDSQAGNLVATAWQGKYLLALTPVGSSANSLLLEVYANLPREKDDGEHPVMAHSIPAQAFAAYPGPVVDELFFTDASITPSDNREYIRQYASGGSDTDGASTPLPITAQATSGAMLFNTEQPKRVRRIIVDGRGNLSVGISSDFQGGAGETANYQLAEDGVDWGDPTLIWNAFDWPVVEDTQTGSGWYVVSRGRYFQITVRESSTDVATQRSALGLPSQPAGGAAVYSMVVRIVPLAVP